ncbi:MAG TPA: NAD(P)/FAD-dependent oxidoreductase [Myxococcales bacterium]|nr:NAD(P)/FAD-dependent oxidoreductase [Myxococcales bacterium]
MRPKRVLVLGGGVAGLAAAVELRRRGLSVTLVEASERLGGRVQTELDPDGAWPLELGAEFVHGRPPVLLAALKRARVGLYQGRGDFWIAGAGGGGPWQGFDAFHEALARTLRPGARDLSVRALSREPPLRDAPAAARAFADSFTSGYYVAPPERASARAIARMEAAADAIGGDQGAQLPRGYGEWVRWLVARLSPEEVRRGARVRRVAWRRHRVRVDARSLAGAALAFEADRAVVALPLPALQRGGVSFRPALGPQRRAAEALRMGNALKVFLRLRGELRRGQFFCIAPGQPVPTWWRGAPRGSPWVVGWAGGPVADRLDRLDDAGLLRASLASLAVAFDESVASLRARLDGFRAARWSRDPLARGAYAWVPVGADGAMAELAAPAGDTLFFAGEATHPEHAGTVHGAYESGLRAARELLGSLGR